MGVFFALCVRLFGGGKKRRVAPAPPDSPSEITLIIIGCDNAGKSTLIASLCGGKIDSEITPTVGFNLSIARRGGQALRLFDVGGGKNIRSIWDSYYADVHGAIFVVDAAEADRFDEVRGPAAAAWHAPRAI